MGIVSQSVTTARSSSQQLAGQAPRTCATTLQSAPPPLRAVLVSVGSLLYDVSSTTNLPLGGRAMGMHLVMIMTTTTRTLIKNSAGKTLPV
jgi:hypothetical protein